MSYHPSLEKLIKLCREHGDPFFGPDHKEEFANELAASVKAGGPAAYQSFIALLDQLVICRNEWVRLSLSIASHLPQSPEMVAQLQRIAAASSLAPRPSTPAFRGEVEGGGKVGWTASRYEAIQETTRRLLVPSVGPNVTPDIKFACPECKKEYSAPATCAGSKGQCSSCGKYYLIPEDSGALAIPFAEANRADSPRSLDEQIRFRCSNPICQKRLKAPHTHEGRRVRCSCGQSLVVPSRGLDPAANESRSVSNRSVPSGQAANSGAARSSLDQLTKATPSVREIVLIIVGILIAAPIIGLVSRQQVETSEVKAMTETMKEALTDAETIYGGYFKDPKAQAVQEVYSNATGKILIVEVSDQNTFTWSPLNKHLSAAAKTDDPKAVQTIVVHARPKSSNEYQPTFGKEFSVENRNERFWFFDRQSRRRLKHYDISPKIPNQALEGSKIEVSDDEVVKMVKTF